MADEPARITREKRTVRVMIRIYCRANHRTGGELCEDCRGLEDYATRRLDCCQFSGEKPTCADCPVHCYKPAMRERVQRVMKFSGPRMVFRHPVMAIMHLWDGRGETRNRKLEARNSKQTQNQNME